jgi:hypothetical protein
MTHQALCKLQTGLHPHRVPESALYSLSTVVLPMVQTSPRQPPHYTTPPAPDKIKGNQ